MQAKTIAILLTSSFIVSSLALIYILHTRQGPFQAQLARQESQSVADLIRPNMEQTQERWSFRD
jgi:hypothetical protein